ncbi:MAG: hypothetical protein NUV80_04760 [Candidatus Berkelbacteria bacterium]|nr:hypothetical protein [Candidatus Berkelbacteria bacterium]MCR4307851.1 hypothetical protein [Candidatus Berkelbacteria bacterium]
MSRKLMAMMLAIGLVIGLVGGFFGGYFYNNFKAAEETSPPAGGGTGGGTETTGVRQWFGKTYQPDRPDGLAGLTTWIGVAWVNDSPYSCPPGWHAVVGANGKSLTPFYRHTNDYTLVDEKPDKIDPSVRIDNPYYGGPNMIVGNEKNYVVIQTDAYTVTAKNTEYWNKTRRQPQFMYSPKIRSDVGTYYPKSFLGPLIREDGPTLDPDLIICDKPGGGGTGGGE